MANNNRTITIQITKGDPSSCELTLKDGNTTSANPGDYIEWQIMPNSGVKQILGIIVDAGSNDVFKPDPGPVDGSTSWRGRINPEINEFIQENYSIEWSTTGSGWLNEGEGRACLFEPIIKVNPKQTEE